MITLDFIREDGRKGGSECANFGYTDKKTGRIFNVREIVGGNPFDRATGKDEGDADRVRYFLEEYIPNGRLVKDGATRATDTLADIPDAQWKKARKSPSAAWGLCRKYTAEHPGFYAISWGGGLGSGTIFYLSLESCALAINNALETDIWVQDHEPPKYIMLGERINADFKAKALLDRSPGCEQIMAAILELGAALAPAETLFVAEHCGGIRLDVTDAVLEHPENARLFLLFRPTGQLAFDENRHSGFYRGGWGKLANRIAGRHLPNYDGPAGIANGLPAFGQGFQFAVQPEDISDLEVLHKQDDSSNKIYLAVTVGKKRFFAWGKFLGGKLQTMPTKGRDTYSKFSEKRDEGYERIEPSRVPDIWKRLLEAANSMQG